MIDEPGRETVLDLWDAAEVVATGRLAYPEARAALAAAHRIGRLTDSALAESTLALDVISDGLTIIDLDAALAKEAGDLAEVHALRGYDAVHLASALALASASGEVVLATWDKRLHLAAAASGLHVAPATV